MKKSQLGFTIIELVVVMGILLMLFGFASLGLISSQKTVSVNTALETLKSDLSLQQTKAMQGVGISSGTKYGVYFQPQSYTLFKGSTYSATDTANFVVTLDPGIAFTNVTFPGTVIVFASGNGEIQGFTTGQNAITLQSQGTVKTKTITINRYGAIISEN
jgi:prepilin-type N-terminal cleavage/methylation domain-containing protein